jgi:ABC-2 type transport system ATP-binding protein
MGMRQRLALAAALLGDPDVLVLDEPANGLDPPGIRWLRDLMRSEAGRGRAVLVSSHLLAEVSQSVDDIVVIANGKLRAEGTLEEVLGGSKEAATRVRSQDDKRLRAALEADGAKVDEGPAGGLLVPGTTPEAVGAAAAREGIALIELVASQRSLEDAFFELTGGGEA